MEDSSNPTPNIGDSVEEITDEKLLKTMLDNSDDFEFRRRIRSRLRELRKANPTVGDNISAAIKPTHHHKVDTTRQTRPVRKRDENDKTDRPSGLKSSSDRVQGKSDLESVSLRRVNDGPRTNKHPADDSKKKQETVSLRKVGLSSTDSSKPAGVRVGEFQGVTLRKVETEKPAASDSKVSARSTARTVTPKMAMERFKQLDAESPQTQTKSQLLVSEDSQSSDRRRSPSPSNIRQAMLDWCRYRTFGYKNVDIVDFSSSWSDGLAFCALINSFFPEAFDFDLLDPAKPRHNFQLAFDTAEKLGGVVPLLEAEDMIATGSNPDWKCIFMYVNSIYSELAARKKTSTSSNQDEPPTADSSDN